MSGGGSGGSGTQKYEWNDEIKPYWQNALQSAENIYTQPYNPYPYQQIADQSPDQLTAMNAIRQWTDQGGSAPSIAANNQAQSTLQGNYLNSNPYASASNPYSGFGSQFNSVLKDELGNITDAYKNGTAADTTRMFNMAGAFGGSAHQNAMANNEAALGKSLSQAANSMYNDQFNRSAGLAESGLNRGASAYEGERGRMTGAIGAGQNSNNQFLQGVNALMGVGDANRSFEQDQLNNYKQMWDQQNNYQTTQLDYLTGILGRAQGGISPNMASSTSGYAASPYSQLLGAGLLAYGMK